LDLSSTGQRPNNGPDAAAVDKSNVAKVQDDGAAIAQQPGNVRPQRVALAACNNPSVAAHDGDASNLASIKRQAQ
jgi:hypothetical protein